MTGMANTVTGALVPLVAIAGLLACAGPREEALATHEVKAPEPPQASQAACPIALPLQTSDVFIAYIGYLRITQGVHVGPVRALGIVRDGVLCETDGAFMFDTMRLWRVLDPTSPPFALRNVSGFLDRMGEDHWVYHAETGGGDLPFGTLLSSKPMQSSQFKAPNEEDWAFFRQHNANCVGQGDPDPATNPTCERPELIAVSDIDSDGSPEYWATRPYMWDTGITVWKRTPQGLIQVLEVCSGCSD